MKYSNEAKPRKTHNHLLIPLDKYIPIIKEELEKDKKNLYA